MAIFQSRGSRALTTTCCMSRLAYLALLCTGPPYCRLNAMHCQLTKGSIGAPARCNANALASKRRYGHPPSLGLGAAPQIDSGLVLRHGPTSDALFCLRTQILALPSCAQSRKVQMKVIKWRRPCGHRNTSCDSDHKILNALPLRGQQLDVQLSIL